MFQRWRDGQWVPIGPVRCCRVLRAVHIMQRELGPHAPNPCSRQELVLLVPERSLETRTKPQESVLPICSHGSRQPAHHCRRGINELQTVQGLGLYYSFFLEMSEVP